MIYIGPKDFRFGIVSLYYSQNEDGVSEGSFGRNDKHI